MGKNHIEMKGLGMTIKKAMYGLIRQKAFSIAQIAGTAISVAMVSVMVSLINMKVSDIYPEHRRNRIMKLYRIVEYDEETQNSNFGGPGRKFVERFMEGIPHIESVSIVSKDRGWNYSPFSGTDGRTATMHGLFVDKAFWDMFSFEFISGNPIPDEGYDAVNPQAVISESAAVALFGTADAAGCLLHRDSLDIMVSGVVRDVSPAADYTFAHIWLPFEMVSSGAEYGYSGLLENGSFALCMSDSFFSNREIRAELEERIEVYNDNNPDGIRFEKVVFENALAAFLGKDSASTIVAFVVYFLLIVVVPSLNSLGLVSHRISRRREEFAIMRAYGAPGKSVVRQILDENLLFTSVGAVLGLVMAFVFMKFSDSIVYKFFMLNFGSSGFSGVPSSRPTDLIYTDVFEISSFFRLNHFIVIVFSVFVINTVSSLIPALKIVREDIVSGLNSRK